MGGLAVGPLVSKLDFPNPWTGSSSVFHLTVSLKDSLRPAQTARHTKTDTVTNVHHFPTRRSKGGFPALRRGEGERGKGKRRAKKAEAARGPRFGLHHHHPQGPSSHPHTNLQKYRIIFLLLPSDGYSETVDDDQNYFCSRKR